MTAMTDLSGIYEIDPAHSQLSFVARHSMITKVRGAFTRFTGTAHVDGANPSASTVAVDIEVASVDTGSPDRDEHLRGSDFFDTERHPRMTFASTAVEVLDADTVEVTGDLTIKDITRPVTVPFTFTGVATDPFGNERAGFTGSTTVNRRDFNLTWNAALDTGGVLVSEKIVLEFEVSAIRRG